MSNELHSLNFCTVIAIKKEDIRNPALPAPEKFSEEDIQWFEECKQQIRNQNNEFREEIKILTGQQQIPLSVPKKFSDNDLKWFKARKQEIQNQNKHFSRIVPSYRKKQVPTNFFKPFPPSVPSQVNPPPSNSPTYKKT
jgi:hypothetical protein